MPARGKGLAHRVLDLFVERRSGKERRKKQIPVKIDRRSDSERRAANYNQFGVDFMCQEIKTAFMDWSVTNRPISQLGLISNKDRVLRCEWGLWKAILRYDLRDIDFTRDVYVDPLERDKIFKELNNTKSVRRTIRIKGGDGAVIVADAVFARTRGEFFAVLQITDVEI